MLTDVIGREIRVGDIVTYPGRRGSGMWMNVGLVEEIGDTYVKVRVPTTRTTYHDKGWSDHTTTKTVTLRVLDRFTVTFPATFMNLNVDMQRRYFEKKFGMEKIEHHRYRSYGGGLVDSAEELK